MKIRRYLGHDCDSIQGFNNGHYIDDKPIEVNGYDGAVEACIEALKERYDFEEFEDVGSDRPCIEVITGYYKEDGTELTKKEFEALEDDTGSWTYVYVSAEVENE